MEEAQKIKSTKIDIFMTAPHLFKFKSISWIAIYLIFILTIQNSIGEIERKWLFEVQTTDGEKVEAAFQQFNPNDETFLFVTAGGKEMVIACNKLTPRTLRRAAMRMTVIPNFLPEKSAGLCNAVVSAPNSDKEKKALTDIYSAGAESSIKEKMALFQLYGVISQLLNKELALIKAQKPFENAEKLALEFETRELKWLERNRFSPLTGLDRTKDHLDFIQRGIAKIVGKPRMTMRQAKSSFMIRLASVQAYAIHCEKQKQPDIAKAVGDIRTKVLKRSIIGREMDKAADAILAWLISRAVVHYYAGEEQAYFLGVFGKLVLDAQVDQAFEILFFDMPKEQRALGKGAIKGALIKLTEGRITPREIVSGSTREALLKLLATQSLELKTATEVADRVMPFLEEAVRMSSK